ncbi:hypothetical protein RJ640_027529 [Escallonia rubra]|uniref:Uncharacterized protein n=1 Tax=Escallonia rubra TaxID=112253 RepID=A0AA88UMU1_9ASTE|nr:hypothetical protein RJ640_027529 [Escallonia rubra]
MVSEHEICDDKYKPRMSSKKAHQGRKEEQWTSIFSWPVTVIGLQGCKKVDCPPQCTCGCFIGTGLKPGKPYTHSFDLEHGRLHISQSLLSQFVEWPTSQKRLTEYIETVPEQILNQRMRIVEVFLQLQDGRGISCVCRKV